MHQSFLFFLASPHGCKAVPQEDYVKLVRGEQPLPGNEGSTIRVADWYVCLADEKEAKLDNETYSFLTLDMQGFVDWSRCRQGRAISPEFFNDIQIPNDADSDENSKIQKLQAHFAEQFTWYPSRTERVMLCKLLLDKYQVELGSL